MDQPTVGSTTEAPDQPPAKPAAPPQRIEEIVRRVKLELLSGGAAKHERGGGFNPYDRGAVRDLWGRRRRA